MTQDASTIGLQSEAKGKFIFRYPFTHQSGIIRLSPEISLVLMDIKMPVMNGIEANRIIKKLRKDLPVIAVTAHGMSGDEANILGSGFDDYLPKPCHSEALMKKLSSYRLTSIKKVLENA